MPPTSIVQTQEAPAAVGPYAQARWAGDLLFLSGQIGLDPASGKLVGEAVADQARQALKNLTAVLGAAGLGWSQVVKATIFLTDMADFQTVNEIYAGCLADVEALPARACVQVAALPLGARFEIEAVACR